MKKPTSTKVFESRTPLMLDVVITHVMEQKGIRFPINGITQQQLDNFANHANEWIRWFHANNKQWRKKIESNAGREWLYTFVGHWCDAFKLNPDTYLQRHTLDSLATGANS